MVFTTYVLNYNKIGTKSEWTVLFPNGIYKTNLNYLFKDIGTSTYPESDGIFKHEAQIKKKFKGQVIS
jgi:hypothetical protein